MVPTTAEIRKFLTELFNDEELTSLCYDYFRDVYLDFALGMSKGQKIQRLIERCDHREAIPNLLAAMAAERAAQYDARFGAPVEAVVSPAEQPRHGRDARQVFISHAHEDADFAHRLAADLQTHGWRVWIVPNSILPGEKWVDAIERGLAASGVFVVALTPAAIRSRWVRTETNAAIALEHREAVRLVPLDVEACDAPVLWSSYQSISFRNTYEDGLRGLLNWLDPPEMSIALALSGILTIESPIHLELVRVPAGEFLMGSDPQVDEGCKRRRAASAQADSAGVLHRQVSGDERAVRHFRQGNEPQSAKSLGEGRYSCRQSGAPGGQRLLAGCRGLLPLAERGNATFLPVAV
jgi:hypothetical protein